jgi:hypothetical protein
MICRKNGSLTREHIRNKYSHSDWDSFSQSFEKVPAGNNGKIGFYFLETEIYPAIKGFYFFDKGNATYERSLFVNVFHCKFYIPLLYCIFLYLDDNLVRESDWLPEEHVRYVFLSFSFLPIIHS